MRVAMKYTIQFDLNLKGLFGYIKIHMNWRGLSEF
jgi:hypothetical protein